MKNIKLKSSKIKKHNPSIIRAIYNEDYDKAEAYLKRGDTIPYTLFDAIFMKGKLEPLVWAINKNAPIANCGHENLFMMKWDNKEEQNLAKKMFLSYVKKNNLENLFPSDYCLNLAKTFLYNVKIEMNNVIEMSEKEISNVFEHMNIVQRMLDITSENTIFLGNLSKVQNLELECLKDQYLILKEKYQKGLGMLSVELQEKYNINNNNMFKTIYTTKDIMINNEPQRKKKIKI